MSTQLKTAVVFAIIAILLLIAGWNGIYNLNKLAETGPEISSTVYVEPKTHRALIYLTASGVAMVLSACFVFLARESSNNSHNGTPKTKH